MKSKEFFMALDALEKEKKIPKEKYIDALESGLTTAFKKIYGEAKSAYVKLNPERQTIEIYSYKTIVDEVEDEDKEVTLAQAKEIVKNDTEKMFKIKDGKLISEENSKGFGRVPSSNVKHVIMQKLKEIIRQNDYNLLSDKKGNLLSAEIIRSDNVNYYLNMGGMEAEGILPKKLVIKSEKFVPGDRIKVLVINIEDIGTGTQVIVSRTHADFVRKLFELEIPEILNGDIEIEGISREPGFRTKISVSSADNSIDPVGACIGPRGTRINNVIAELGDEKIDIIPFDSNPAIYIANALSPSKVISVTINESQKSALAIVPDDKLSLAIGRSGQNVRLAARLTGWKIDVRSESQSEEYATEVARNINVDSVELSDEDLFGEID